MKTQLIISDSNTQLTGLFEVLIFKLFLLVLQFFFLLFGLFFYISLVPCTHVLVGVGDSFPHTSLS